MKLEISFVEPYLKLNNPKRREHYQDYNQAATQHDWHFDGKYPTELIERKRPSEDSDIRQYRKDSFQPMTKPTATKVLSSLQKIRKSPDWNVSSGAMIPRIATDEDIYNYCYHNFPIFHSIERWAFNYFLRNYLTDAGAMVITIPISFEVQDNEYFKPYSWIVESDDVFEYSPNEYIIWESEETHQYKEGNKIKSGFVCYALTTTMLYRYVQTDSAGKFSVDLEFEHNLNFLTAYPVGVVVTDTEDKLLFYETRIAGIIPALNEAIALYSDIQAEVVQHVHSTMYTYQAQECTGCNGSGVTLNEQAVQIKCSTCNGKGVFPFNPYDHVVIRPQNLGDAAPPTPPVGYIQKNTEIITILDNRYKQQLYDALSAINMEFLTERPLNQSGTAKQVDAEELNNFVYSVAEDIVHAIERSTYDCALWRYSSLALSEEEFYAMLPKVNVPTHFDIVSDSVMLDEITRMSTAKIDPTLIKASNIAYAKKKFSTSPEVADEVVSRMMLDPLSGMGEDQILMGKQDGFISDINLVIHYNVNEFIDKASDDYPNWMDMSKREKKDVMVKYALEYLNGRVEEVA